MQRVTEQERTGLAGLSKSLVEVEQLKENARVRPERNGTLWMIQAINLK